MPLALMQDLVVEMTTLGIDLFVCAILYYSYHGLTSTADSVLSAPQVSLEAIAEGRERPELPYAVVRGRVRPLGSSLNSQYSAKTEGVIQKVSFVEHASKVNVSGYWSSNEREMHTFANSVPFGLTPTSGGPESSPAVVEVTQWERAWRVDLDVVYDHFDDSGVSVGGSVVGLLSGDIHRGVLTTERMLCTDSVVTAIGELSVGKDGGAVVTVPRNGKSYFIVKATPQSLAQDLRDDASAIGRIILVFAGIGAVLLGRLVFLGWTRHKQQKVARENAQVLEAMVLRREGRKRSAGSENLSEESTCNVCMESPKEVKLLKCGHECLCARCALRIVQSSQKCPICRTTIEKVARIKG